MKLTIDLAQSPKALLAELTQAVRFALGAEFYIEQGDHTPNFDVKELVDPNVNMVDLNSSSVVPSASATSTPTGSGAAATPLASGVELDSQGHPYDVRIHSGGKSKIANGTWKLAKGMSSKLDYVAQINAQNVALLTTALPSSAPSNVVTLPGLGGVADMPPIDNTPPALPTLPPVAQVAAPDVEIVVTDYPTLAQYVAQQMVAKPVTTKTQLELGLKHYGLVDAAGNADLTAVAHRPDVVATFYPWLKATIALGQG